MTKVYGFVDEQTLLNKSDAIEGSATQSIAIWHTYHYIYKVDLASDNRLKGPLTFVDSGDVSTCSTNSIALVGTTRAS